MSSSSSFSGASRPTYPTSIRPSGASCRRSPSSRSPGWNASRSTPRGHSASRGTARSSSCRMLAVDGARVRSDEGVDLACQVGHGPDAAGTEPGLGVPLGETDQVGLVDRHARDAQLHGRARRLEPERGRRGDVDHVGAEPQHLRTQPGPRLEADAEVPVERQRRPASGAQREPGVRRGAGRGHQLGLVPLEREVLQHSADRVGDAVDLREERLRDDQDTQRGVRHVSDGREATATGSRHSCNGA